MKEKKSEWPVWEESGEYIDFEDHKLFVKEIGEKTASSDRTLLLLHGFPESSFSFHLVTSHLLRYFDRIVMFDMIGFGLSDKPSSNYSYSLLKQADSALAVWKYFGVKGGHLLAHDMGDSVATELLARQQEKSIPSWFSEDFQSFTFTNGSMVLKFSKLRIIQKLLLSRLGFLLKNLTTYKIFQNQVLSAHGNQNLKDSEITKLWQTNTYKDGQKIAYLTIHYISDR